MRVVLDFSLYMMRFGMAKLAASFADPSRPTPTKQINNRFIELITKKISLDGKDLSYFNEYLKSKPGSPRYSPLRKSINNGRLPKIELQDLWLSQTCLKSSVGALSKNYYDDPLNLAQILGLVKPRSNILLNRGLLSKYDDKKRDNPFLLDIKDEILLGLLLVDVDGDWIWAFLFKLLDPEFKTIDVKNRVELLLGTFRILLDADHLKSSKLEYIVRRKRIIQLLNITERNIKEGLNLGQPWSWFLIPRLELLVDANILLKSQPHSLTGYSLSDVGKALLEDVGNIKYGKELINNFFHSHSLVKPRDNYKINWNDIKDSFLNIKNKLRAPTGYYPLFETAIALAIDRYQTKAKSDSLWEIPEIESVIRSVGSGEGAEVILGIDRHGHVSNFKVLE